MSDLVVAGEVLIATGILVVLVAAAVSGRSPEEKEGRVKGGAVILIGPIPIVFGSDAKWASVAIALAIVLIVAILLSGVLSG